MSNSTKNTQKTASPANIKKLYSNAIDKNFSPIMLYAIKSQKKDCIELRYLFDKLDGSFETWILTLKKGEQAPSLSTIFPMLSWDEREISDLFGVKFKDHPHPHPLVLHEGMSSKTPPLLSEDKNLKVNFEPTEFTLPKISDKKLQHLMFGPICAGIRESTQYDYYYAGETIAHTDQKLFFKHKGIEKKFQKMSVDHGMVLAQRVSGIGSFSHGLAYCQALESACDCEVPEKAKISRVILSELERLYNHLEFMGQLCNATTLKVGGAQGTLLSEMCKQINIKVTGDRLLRNIITPGGIKRPIRITGLRQEIIKLRKDTTKYLKRLDNSKSHLDRLYANGKLDKNTAIDLGATGPIARASNIYHDLRKSNPYAYYDQLSFNIAHKDDGDAFARFQVRALEIETSFDLILKCLNKMKTSGPVSAPFKVKANTEGIGWCESPRGGTFYAVHIDEDKTLKRVKIRSASFCNWRVYPHTVQGSAIMDFIINEASFGLSIAGCDR